MRVHLFAVLLWSPLAGIGCAPPEEAAPIENVVPVADAGGVEADALADPQATCNALVSEGFTILPRTRWNPELTGGYDCTSEEVVVTSGFPLDNTVTFYVNGTDDGEAVEFARLTADVFMPDESGPVLDKLAASAVTFARHLGAEEMATLRAAAAAGEAATVPMGDYEAEVTRELYRQGYGVVVTFQRAT